MSMSFGLQWGRSKFAAEKFRCVWWSHRYSCFNGAAANSLRKKYHGRSQQPNGLASMGPQQIRCGKTATAVAADFVAPASMGPQQIRCGKDRFFFFHRLSRIASMGPQQIRCGKCRLANHAFHNAYRDFYERSLTTDQNNTPHPAIMAINRCQAT